jgi:hypothetical protein
MYRFWLTFACACCLVGCSGYQMGGKWVGSMPLPGADNCLIKFYPGSDFDFVCGKPDSWSGIGKYKVRGDALEMEYRVLIERGTTLKVLPQPLKLHLDGRMNNVAATLPNGQTLNWHREM